MSSNSFVIQTKPHVIITFGVLHKKETTGREQSSFCLVVHTSLLSLSSVEYLHMTLYTTRDSH